MAFEIEKTEAEDLVELCTEFGSGYHVRYFNDRQRLWTNIIIKLNTNKARVQENNRVGVELRIIGLKYGKNGGLAHL